MIPLGLEPFQDSPKNNAIYLEGGAKCGALLAKAVLNDPQLVEVIKFWPDLPDAVKEGIVAIVQVAKAENK